MSENNHGSRLTAYKHGAQGVQDLRRKRIELSVTLRKQARDEQLLKRRIMSPEEEDDEITSSEPLPTPAEIVEGLKSSNVMTMTTAAKAARKMLSQEHNPPINVMVNAGVIRPLVKALERDDCPDLQFEAAWALTNIASGTHDNTMAVIEGGAVPKLIDLVTHGGSVGEQATWALGNIAGDGAQTRDLTLKHGFMSVLLPCLSAMAPTTKLSTAIWSFSNLCRNKNPLVKFDLVAPALPAVCDILAIQNADILADACWAISYLTDGPDERIEEVQNTPHILERLIKLLDHKDAKVKTPALRAIGNMLTGNDVQTDRCIDLGCIAPLSTLLKCSKPSLVKEACWAISNIVAGTQAQIQKIIEAGVVQLLTNIIHCGDVRSQKEAAWCITNLCLGGTPQQLEAMLCCGVLEPYCNLLGSTDHRTVIVVLDGITHLLMAAEKFGEVSALCIKLEEIGALDKIEALQHHENTAVYQKVVHIVDTYFKEEEEVMTAPQQNEQEFQFGSNDNGNLQF